MTKAVLHGRMRQLVGIALLIVIAYVVLRFLTVLLKSVLSLALLAVVLALLYAAWRKLA